MVKLVLSHKLFNGYMISVARDELLDLQDIGLYVSTLFKTSLRSVFMAHGLDALVDEVNKLPVLLHIHFIDDILTATDDETFYICCQCHALPSSTQERKEDK